MLYLKTGKIPLRYRLIKPDWAKNNEAVPGPNSFDIDDATDEFLCVKNGLGYGVYYFPNYNSRPFDGDYLAGRLVDVFEWVYVDMDLKDGVYKTREEFVERVAGFPILPNKIVSSGHGVHAYWRVADLDRERFVSLQLRLIREFNTDKSIWTVLRCMRLEGYYNTKQKDDFKLVECDVLSTEPCKYTDLIAHLPPLTAEDEKKMTNHLRKIDGLEPEINLDDVDLEEIPERFTKLLDGNKKVQALFLEEGGDRSENDYQLACILFEKDFPKKEALAVIANTNKARSLGAGKLSYVTATVDKVYSGKVKYSVPSAAEMIRSKRHEHRRGQPVNGPSYFDCLVKKWRTQQVLGLVGGTGIGKSTVSLDMFKGMIENNPEADDIYIYFNLEMPAHEILEKWSQLTYNDAKLAERLYVVSNEDDEGNPRHINLQQIVWYCQDIQKSTGRKIAAIVVDHIGVINPTIDITKKPDFGLKGDMEGSYGDLRNVTPRRMPQLIKELAKQLDCFVVIQSQTTKAKGGDGDFPLGIDAAYGASQFEHFCDYVMTLWQPIRRVADRTKLRVLGWQYCKVRSRHKDDEVQTYQPCMLSVDMATGALAPLTEAEEEEFVGLNKAASILRKQADKKEEVVYKNSVGGLKKLRSLLAAKAN